MTEHVRLDDVVGFLDERLEVSKFDEEESNGLIVRASDVVTSIAAAVSTSFHAISRAKSAQADLLIVHHRSWPQIDLELVEEKHTRLRQNGISLYCAHSALDAASGISNGDGIADAVFANYGNASVTVVLGGRREFALAPGSPLKVGSHPSGVAVGDLNGDGKADIVTTNEEDNDISVLLTK